MKEETKIHQESSLTKLNQTLKEGVQEIFKSDKWKNYLKMYENFSNYSYQNKVLVFLQKPDAEMVKGYRTWEKDYHRTVKRGEKAIKIFAPTTYNKILSESEFEMRAKYDKSLEEYRDKIKDGYVKIPIITYTVANVFDVSQTEGEPLPEHKIRKALTGNVKDYDKVLQMLVDISPCPVDFANIQNDSSLTNAYGYYKPSENHIVLRDDMSEEMTIKVLIHEMAHSLLHGEQMLVEGVDDTSFLKKKDLKEIQAESVAYIVCNEFGIDSSMESFGYVAEYANEDIKKLENTLEVIEKTVDEIDKRLETYKDKEKVQEQEQR